MRKYLRDRVRELMKLDDPPHKMAFAFALGIFIAFSPWIGLHILSCIFFAWFFRVSKFVVLTASFVNNPWTMVPIYAFNLWIGVRLTGGSTVIPDIQWNKIGFQELFTILKPFLWSFVAGSLTIGAVASVFAYIIFYWAVVRFRRPR